MTTIATVMPLLERKERLTQFAREDTITEKGVPLRSSNIKAIEALNKMEDIYQRQPIVEGNKILNIIVSDEETGDIVREMMGVEKVKEIGVEVGE
jgi:hypothetical protein|tara:strand:+ start:480 stop:764 length:285 start_codon:yes stop_codon:yes gene_type:complete